MLITACAGQSARREDAAGYSAASAWSFEQEATTALLARLQNACRSIENVDDCIKSRAVSAFDAEEGEFYCRHQDEPRLFVQCVVNGSYATHMADKLELDLPIEIRWGDKAERMALINGALADQAGKDLLLLLEIEQSDISQCPIGEMGNVCIGKVAVAHFIKRRLAFIL